MWPDLELASVMLANAARCARPVVGGVATPCAGDVFVERDGSPAKPDGHCAFGSHMNESANVWIVGSDGRWPGLARAGHCAKGITENVLLSFRCDVGTPGIARQYAQEISVCDWRIKIML